MIGLVETHPPTPLSEQMSDLASVLEVFVVSHIPGVHVVGCYPRPVLFKV